MKEDPEVWRKFAEEFRTLDPDRLLSANWIQDPRNSSVIWTLRAPVNVSHARSLESRFAALATRAAKELRPNSTKTLMDVWLDVVRTTARCHEQSGIETLHDGTTVTVSFGVINGLCEDSANHCSILERIALEVAHADSRDQKQQPKQKKAPSARPVVKKRTSSKQEPTRAQMIAEYKRECNESGIKVTDTMIAKEASPSWNHRTPVARWKANDPRCTNTEDRLIRRVLRDKPHLKRP